MRFIPNRETMREVVAYTDLKKIQEKILTPMMLNVNAGAIIRKQDGGELKNLDELLLDLGLEIPKDISQRDALKRRIALDTILKSAGADPGKLPKTHPELYALLLGNTCVMYPWQLAEDPYFKKIKIPPKTAGPYELTQSTFHAGEYEWFDVPDFSLPYRTAIGKLCAYDETVDAPALYQDGQAWMTVTPNEISTMRGAVKTTSGRVLTLGCGLGYFAYMTHLKPDVETVEIVEIDPIVIGLFQDAILPQFDFPEKIRITQADAFDYVRNLDDGKFDYCFADVWRNAMDYPTYVRLRTACRRFVKTRFDYWIEDSILWSMAASVDLLFMQSVTTAIGKSTPMDSNLPDGTDDKRLMTFMNKLLSRETLDTPEKMRNIFSPAYLKNLIQTRTSVNWPVN